MSTARDLITGSLKLLGVIAQGETASASEASDGLASLNSLLDSYATEQLMIYGQTRETFNLVGGQSSYLMGPELVPAPVFPDLPTVDFDTVRPVAIKNAAIEYQGDSTFEVPCEIINPDQYAAIGLKTMTGDPRKIYVESLPKTMKINVFPVPASGMKLALYSLKPISKLTSLNSDLGLPPGYERMLRYNLAIELAPEYGKEPSIQVQQTALDSKSNVKRMNSPEILMRVDTSLISNGGFDIRSGS